MRALKGAMMRNIPLMMTCQEFDSSMHDYVERSLPPGERRRFRLHITLCRECRTYLEDYEMTVLLGKAAFSEQEVLQPSSPPERVVRAILNARRG